MKTQRFGLSHINTSESYYGEFIIRGDVVCIPVINLGLMQEHALNGRDRQLFIDKSYLFFRFVASICFNENSEVSTGNPLGYNVFYFGGQDLFGSAVYELKILYKEGELILMDDSQIADTMWVPMHTPLIRQNMDNVEVMRFVHNEMFSNVRFFL